MLIICRTIWCTIIWAIANYNVCVESTIEPEQRQPSPSPEPAIDLSVEIANILKELNDNRDNSEDIYKKFWAAFFAPNHANAV